MKNPEYSDTLYVTDLVTDGTVNTMPEKTMNAFADHGEVSGDQVRGQYDDAKALMGRLAELGIEYDDVIEALEEEGVEKFVASWQELVGTVEGQMEQSRK